MTTDDVALALSPSTPQVLGRIAAQNLVTWLRGLDGATFARLIGACQAEATERGMLAAIKPLGDAQSAAEDFAREDWR